MLLTLTRNWWLVALRGVLAILFGLGAFFWPSITLLVLVTMFGVYAFLGGLAVLIAAIGGADQNSRWWVLALEGALGVIAGILTFFWPGITALTLLYIIAFWAILTGVLEVIAAVRLRKDIHDEWLLGLSGVISVLFGILVLAQPGAGALAVVWIIGAWAVITGISLLAFAFKLHSAGEAGTAGPAPIGGVPA
jgi:uncharacterized membrane protein HdeD (DUF308 family)